MLKSNELRLNKIHHSNSLTVEVNSKSSNLSILAFRDHEDSFQNYNNLMLNLKFIPNHHINFYYPEVVINPLTLGDMKVVKERNEYLSKITKQSKLKIVRVSKLPEAKVKLSNEYHTIMPFDSLYKRIEEYTEKTKKTDESKYSFLKLSLKKVFDSLVHDDNGINFFLQIKDNSEYYSLLHFIAEGLRKEPKFIVELFSKVRVILTEVNMGMYMMLDLTSEKVHASTLTSIARFIKLVESKTVSKPDEKANSEVFKDESISTKLVDASIDSIKKINDNPDPINPEEEDSEGLDKKVASPPASEIKGEDSIEPNDEIDLDEILSARDSDDVFAKNQEENDAFLRKYIATQDKVLKPIIDKKVNEDLEVTKIEEDTLLMDNMKKSSMLSITSSYYNNLYKRDLAKIAASLNKDPDLPVIVTSFEMKNNNDPLTMKDELKIGFVDKKGKRHVFNVDVPKLSHDGFLRINGNKKFISKQATLLPVIKEAPDRVQITTNYRKTFIYRKGEKSSASVDKLFKLLVNKKFDGVKQVFGNAYSSNIPFNVSMIYNYIAKRLSSVTFTNAKGSTNGYNIYFSQTFARKAFEEAKIKLDEAHYNPISISFINGKVDKYVYEDTKTRNIICNGSNNKLITQYKNLIGFLESVIENHWNKEVPTAYKEMTSGKVFAFSQIKIASVSIPLGILLSFFQGITGFLERYKIKHEVDTKKRRAKGDEIAISFNDATIYIDCEGDGAKELIVNGLYYLDPKEFSIQDSSKRGALYLDYFGKTTGSRNTGKALLNFESSMIDPITEEILISLNLPTDFNDLLVYGSGMLEGFAHKRKNDMTNFRIRDSEVIAVAVYNTLMNSFNEYKRTSKTGVASPISAPKDAVIKQVMSLPNVEDYSILSPFLEVETKAKATPKGPSGLNSDDAYTEPMRAFDKTMLGIYGVFTPVSDQVGVRRSLTLNPSIVNSRGFLKQSEVDSLNQDQLYAPGELLNGFTANRADPMRICMSVTQGMHITPTIVQHNYLFGTGIDKTLSHLVGQDFAYKASDNGKILSIDQKNNLVFIQYDDGKKAAIDISAKSVKNSSSGFYTTLKLNLKEKLKVGSKFKKGDILAVNDEFFREDFEGSNGFAAGRLTKATLMTLPTTYEDSVPIVERVANEMASEIITEKSVVIKKNSDIVSIAKVGQEVNINDYLIVFQEVGDTAKEALDNLEKSLSGKNAIEAIGKNIVKTKYSGTIVDIKIYYNCDLESPETHPSLRKFVNNYIDTHKRRYNLLKDMRDDEMFELPSLERINSDKILGNEMDGILVSFFIKHLEKNTIGSKVSFFSACKGVISEVIPDEESPLSEYRRDEPIEAFLSTFSLIGRNVPDLLLIGYLNKVMIELKKQSLEILGLKNK